jgi:hypothetical protein
VTEMPVPSDPTSSPSKYKPKATVEREAMYYDGSLESAAAIASWIIQSEGGVRFSKGNNTLIVDGVDGVLEVTPDRYVVSEGPGLGFFYPAVPENFEGSWEVK